MPLRTTLVSTILLMQFKVFAGSKQPARQRQEVSRPFMKPVVRSTPPVNTTLPFGAIVAVVIGNWLEFYDFLVFTFFALMIGNAFFPGESEIGRLLGALATFGVGFFTRPLGAAIIGAY